MTRPEVLDQLVTSVIDRLLEDEGACSCSTCEASAVLEALELAGWLRDTPGRDSLR